LEKAREAAEAANGAKSLFLAKMSHELRIPLQGIIGVAELAEETDDFTRQKEYLRLLKTSAQALLRIVNEIQDLSKIESGKLVLIPRSFDLQVCLDEAIQLLTPQARAKGLLLQRILAPRLPLRLWGDDCRLRQILLNLLGNAIKFTEQGGVTLEVSLHKRKGSSVELHFAVRDTGVGIPLGQQAAVFEAFQQVVSAEARRFEGTGLGLAISTQLVRVLQGRIWLESKMGVGTTCHFTARLQIDPHPRKTKAGRSVLTKSSGKMPGKGLKILLAEDNRTSQLIFTHQLRPLGHHVFVVENGREAVKKWQQESFDLILMDVNLPIMDGYAATAHIRRMENATNSTRPIHTPILALTGMAMSGDEKKCLAAGMDSYVSKPLTKEKLLTAIWDVMKRGKRKRKQKKG
jgi:CheY-like chemotaxis protein